MEETLRLTEEENQLITSAIQELHSNKNQVIPTNPDSLLVDQSSLRFSSASWFNEVGTKDILVAGCGGIGSFVSFILSRIKPRSITIYDDDRVDNTNLAGQLFSTNDINKKKVESIKSFIVDYSNFYCLFTFPDKINTNTEILPITIGCFDNMKARQLLFGNWLCNLSKIEDKNKKDWLFIDARLATEEFQVYCFTGEDTYNIHKYEKECLFTDEEAETTVCSYKQTTFCASMIGSIITNLVVNYCANLIGDYRDLPYFTYYDAKLMYLKTEA